MVCTGKSIYVPIQWQRQKTKFGWAKQSIWQAIEVWAEPLVRGQGAMPPEAESFSVFGRLKNGQNSRPYCFDTKWITFLNDPKFCTLCAPLITTKLSYPKLAT